MGKKEKTKKIMELLKAEFPDAYCALDHTNAHELLFATILSAQCTDARVNMVTPELFKKYATVKDFAEADMEELKELIRSTGFYNNKAKSIKGAAEKIMSDFSGKVPDNMEDLTSLPGVARKTASVVLHHWFKKEEGFIVDTHVKRLATWFGLTEHKDPAKIEKDLMEFFPREEWGDTASRMILLGRKTLTARNPQHVGTVWESLVSTKS